MFTFRCFGRTAFLDLPVGFGLDQSSGLLRLLRLFAGVSLFAFPTRRPLGFRLSARLLGASRFGCLLSFSFLAGGAFDVRRVPRLAFRFRSTRSLGLGYAPRLLRLSRLGDLSSLAFLALGAFSFGRIAPSLEILL